MTVIFASEDYFYPIELLDPDVCGVSIHQQILDNVELNPDTEKVMDQECGLLWDHRCGDGQTYVNSPPGDK